MKIRAILCVTLILGLLLCSATPAVAANDGPSLVAHYTFADASNVGKDYAGSTDLKVIGVTLNMPGTAKQVDGPDGMKALEFNQTYALLSDVNDVTDNLKEFTITYLASTNDKGKLHSNVFTTGAGNGNSFYSSGLNHLIDGCFDPTWGTGVPDFRLMGGDQNVSGQAEDSKWDTNQRKNDDGRNAHNRWAGLIDYDDETQTIGNPYTYETGEWYRVVITVKLSDGTKTSNSTVMWPNQNAGEAFYPGTGSQSMYMAKMDDIASAADLVDGTNYYTTVLPYNLTSIKNEGRGLMIGAAYKVGAALEMDSNQRNYAMLVGKIADFRIYDKALTEEQVVNLYKTGAPVDESKETTTTQKQDGETTTTAPQDGETTTTVNGETTTTAPQGGETTTTAPQGGNDTTTTTEADAATDPADEGGFPVGAIIAIAAVVVIGAAAAVYFLVIRKKK